MNALAHDVLLERLTRGSAREIDASPETRWASVGIVLHARAPGDFDILFIKRSQHEGDPWSGHMAFPGGRHDSHDADLLQTAQRETLEEVGLELPEKAALLGRLNDIQAYARGQAVALVVRPYLFLLQETGEAHRPHLTPNREVEETVWIPLRDLLSGEGHDTLVWERDGVPLELPCIRHKGYTIWGLTYYMLAELLDRVREAIPPSEGAAS